MYITYQTDINKEDLILSIVIYPTKWRAKISIIYLLNNLRLAPRIATQIEVAIIVTRAFDVAMSRKMNWTNDLMIGTLSFQPPLWSPGLVIVAASDTYGGTRWRSTCGLNAGRILPSSVRFAEENSSTNTGGSHMPDWFTILIYDRTTNRSMKCETINTSEWNVLNFSLAMLTRK